MKPVKLPRHLPLILALGATLSLQACVPLIAGGAGVGAMVASDRRTSGAYLEDENIEWKTSQRLTDRFGERIHVNATSYNRNLLLTGEVPNEATKQAVQEEAMKVPNLRALTNEVRIAPISTFGSRSHDALTTSQVKARFIDQGTFGFEHVKVVTEAGTVFLMGMVTPREADAATEIARTTQGVRRVVRVFEFISEEQARRVETKPNVPDPQNDN